MGARQPHTELYYHLVWATWDRNPLITSLEELGCSEIIIDGMADHVHVLCRIPPTLALANLIRQIKGASSHFATHELPGCEEFK